jgi:hypothetical protein
MAANLALLARENDMGIDHAVRGTRNNVFVVEGALDDPAQRRAGMPLAIAEGRDAQQAFAGLNVLTGRLEAFGVATPTPRVEPDNQAHSPPRMQA